MLRISKNDADRGMAETKLRLDGNLVGPWVQELKLLCEPILMAGEKLRIDCSGVSFVDSDGISLMHRLQASGVEMLNCSPFIRLQLNQNGAGSQKTE